MLLKLFLHSRVMKNFCWTRNLNFKKLSTPEVDTTPFFVEETKLRLAWIGWVGCIRLRPSHPAGGLDALDS